MTKTSHGFSGLGGSIGVYQTLEGGILWRTELRYLKASQDVFPKESNLTSENWTAITSWALSF